MTSAAQHGEAPAGTLEQGLSVLEFFARIGEAAASEAVAALGISWSAIYRILDTLQRRGYLEINPTSEKLRLGVWFAELGIAAVSGVDPVRLATLTCTSLSIILWTWCFSRSWAAGP